MKDKLINLGAIIQILSHFAPWITLRAKATSYMASLLMIILVKQQNEDSDAIQ